MNLSVGIVGLPNVGKSTLFNALLKKQVANVANYPFCTIEPNVGVIEVPDKRLAPLANIVNTKKIVPAVVEFYDIAGLVKGASKGEGLGNKFLSHIREVSAIVHVVRLFEDGDVIHVTNKVDPKDDITTIENELMIADLETLSKQKEPKGAATKDEKYTYKLVQTVKSSLDKGVPVRKQNLSDEEKLHLKSLNLLTVKPVIYLFNVSEDQLINHEETKKKINVILGSVSDSRIVAKNNDSGQAGMTVESYLYLNAKLENEVLAFTEDEQKQYLKEFNLEDTGLNRLITKAYEILGLISFLTAGEIEVRAWTIPLGTLAPQAAGTIHSDFEKHFIKADIVTYNDFINIGGWVKAREVGKVLSAGKDHIMQDGDVVDFKVGV